MSWPDDFPIDAVHRIVDVHATMRLEHGGRAQIDAWQAHQWQQLHGWIVANIPWWRERLGDDADWSRPERWPVLTRPELLAMVDRHGAAPVPPEHGPVEEGATSGSSGRPVRFFSTPHSVRMMSHVYLSDHARQGRDPYTLRAVIDERSPTVEAGQTHLVRAGSAVAGTGPSLLRNADQFDVASHLAWLVQHAPPHLTTLPWWLEPMLDAVEAGAPAPQLQQVMPYGATITPAMRARTRAAFGARIVDRYSCKECGPLAFQCPASDDHYHVAVSNVRLEVADEAGVPCADGVTGRVLITSLHQYGTPLVRYDIGDVAALHAGCPACGTEVPTLSQLMGRRLSLLRVPGGRFANGAVRASRWLACAPIRQHRLVQSRPGEVDVDLVAARPLLPDDYAALQAMLREEISPLLVYHLRQVETIERRPGHKPEAVLSLLP